MATSAYGKAHDRDRGHSSLAAQASLLKSQGKDKKSAPVPTISTAIVPVLPVLPLVTLNCGDRVEASMTLANDLICPETTGSALYIVGDNISFDGGGHSIVAPLAGAGIFVQGNNVAISGITINGVLGGAGIFAYDSPAININNSNLSGNHTGMVLYAEQTVMSGISVTGNRASGNSVFGIRTGQAGAGRIESPFIARNDFSNSGDYAMHLGASLYELDNTAANIFLGSANGIYLWGGSFYLHDLSLANEHILFNVIFVDSAVSFNALNLDVSTDVSFDLLQKRSGLDLYKVGIFSIKGLIARNNSVGLKLETEGGAETGGDVTCSQFINNGVSGIMVQSYDATPYGILNFSGNLFQQIPAGYNVWIVPDTAVHPSSQMSAVTEACPGSGGNSCTLTQGYWKNHSALEKNKNQKIAWPVSENTQLCGKSWYQILQLAPKGDAWIILAHQYIAARLNVAAGAATTPAVDLALSSGGTLLQNSCGTTLGSAARTQALLNATILDQYNNGIVGPGHCE